MLSLFSLKGKVALITGATNGIGLGMVKGLADAGIDQLILTYRLEDALEKTKQQLKKINSSVDVVGIKANFSSPDEDEVVKKIVEEAYEIALGHSIDILINNAGTNIRHPFESYPQEDFDQVLRVNLQYPVKLTKQVGSRMLEKGVKGNIVFTASLASFLGIPNASAYAIAKGGIKQLTHVLSNEWSLKGIRVNSIVPGYIETNLTDTLDKTYRDTIIKRIPMGRWGTMDDFQGPIVFLCSDASGYVTGEMLAVDGGWLGF